MPELFVSFYLIIQSFYYCNNIPKKVLIGFFTVCGKGHRLCFIQRKNEPAQMTWKPGPVLAISAIKKVFGSKQALLTLMALKSFFIFSGIPVMKESSGSSRISPFSSFEERTEGKQGSKRGSSSPDQYKTSQAQSWSCRCITGTLRNTKPQRRGQETLQVFYPFLPQVTIACCIR